MRPTKPHLTIISNNSNNNNNKKNMDAVNWVYCFCLLLAFVVHTTQSIRVDVNNNTETIINISTINPPPQESHQFILNDTVTHEMPQEMAADESEVQKEPDIQNEENSPAERSRRLIPLMAFYLPISELPLNKQYAALQMMSTNSEQQQEYEHEQMPENVDDVNGKFVVVKGVDGNIARVAIPASYMHMKMSSFRSAAPSVIEEENTHYASTPIIADSARNPNYRPIAYDDSVNEALKNHHHHDFPTVVAIGDANGNTKLPLPLPRIVHVLSLKAKPNHHIDNTYLTNINHNNNINNKNNAPYASSLSASVPSSTLTPTKQQNPHKFKTVQYFPPIPSSTTLPVNAAKTIINSNNKQVTETIQFLYQSQNHKNNVASAYRLRNNNNNKQQQQQQQLQLQRQSQQQQQQQQQRQQQHQHQSKNNLTPFTATNTIPGHFIPIVYTPINSQTNNDNNNGSHNSNNNNNSNEYKRPSKEEPPEAPTHIFLYDDEDDEIIKQQAQYKHHHLHHYQLQQRQQQQQQQQEQRRPQNAIHYSATLPAAVNVQSSHNPNYYYRYQNSNKHSQQQQKQQLQQQQPQQQHFSEISMSRLPPFPLSLSSTNNLAGAKTFIFSQNNFNHQPKLLISDGSQQQVNFLNDSKQHQHLQQQLPLHHNQQRQQHQLQSKHFQPPRLENFFDGQTPITKEEILHDRDNHNKITLTVAAQSSDATPYNSIQLQRFKYRVLQQQQQPDGHSPQSYIRLNNEQQVFNAPSKEPAPSHVFMLSSTSPSSSTPLPDDTYSSTTIMPPKFPISLQYSSARLVSPNNTPHHSNIPSSSLPQYSKIFGLSTPDGHYVNNVINANAAKQQYKQKLPNIITNHGTSYIAVTTEGPYQENAVTTFKPPLIHHQHTHLRPFYETKLKLQQSPALQLRRPLKFNNNNDVTMQQHDPLIEVRPSSIKPDIKLDYAKEEFGKKLTPLRVASKLKISSHKSGEQKYIQSATTLTDPVADTNDLPDIRTSSLTEILHKLQESNHLPQTLTPDNIDDSIKTLIRILNNLKHTQKRIKIGSAQHHYDECVTDSGPQHVKQQSHKNENVTPKNLGAHSGRAGIDYPNYADIPETSFACSQQRYKGFFGDPETNCQVWHYCDLNGGKASFLCPNGTIFSQIALTCDWWFNVKCATTPQLYVLNERLYKYILPFTPKFPEDYNGPLVDKYLAMKFQEMEEKMRLEREKVNASSLSKMENDLDDVDSTTIDENIEYTTQEININTDKEPVKIDYHSQKQLISEQNPERNLLIDDEINDISQRVKEIHKFESTTIGPTITTSNIAKVSTTKSMNEAFSLSMKPIVVLSSTIEPDYIEENGITAKNDNDSDRIDIPDRIEQNNLNSNDNRNDEIIKTTTVPPLANQYKTSGTDIVNVTVEKVKLVEIKSDGTSGHLVPDILKNK